MMNWNLTRTGAIAIAFVALFVLLVSVASLAVRAGGRGPSAQVPPTGRTPPICFGQGYADLVLDRETVATGERVLLTITEEPGVPVALFADSGMGPVTFPTIGTFCLDFGPDQRTLADGIFGGGADRTDDQGVFLFSLRIPDRPSLRGLMFHVQGAVETVNAPNGISITPMRGILIEG